MKANYLFPYRYKSIGWILLIVGILLGLAAELLTSDGEFSFLNMDVLSLFPSNFGNNEPSPLWSIYQDNFTNEILALLLIIGGVFVAFSKEKNEDEYLLKVRLESLVWATYISYGILILFLLFFYEFTFLFALWFNMFTLLAVFIIRFNWILFLIKRKANEK